jgi:hypothetical protein
MENLDLVTLDDDSINQINGGGWESWAILAPFAWAYEEGADFVEGLKDGFKEGITSI